MKDSTFPISVSTWLKFAHNTIYNERRKKFFKSSRKRSVCLINFVQSEFLQMFIKTNLKTGEKLLLMCEHKRQNRVTNEQSSWKLICDLEGNQKINLKQTQSGKLEHNQRQVMDVSSKHDMNSGLHFDRPNFLLFPLKNIQLNNCLLWYYNIVSFSKNLVVCRIGFI